MADDFTIRLDRVFQGPLDLLLHLVREQEVEVQDVEIHRVIDGYLEHLAALEALDLEFAGDFLVMASTLMAIKARALIPREEVDLEDDLDPRDELIQRLIEYRRFKEASQGLEARRVERELLAPRGWRGEVREFEEEPQLELGELTPFDLLTAFSRLMSEVHAGRQERLVRDPRPLRWYVNQLMEGVRASGRMSLRAAASRLEGGMTRESLIGTFCALLELVRLEVVGVEQGTGRDEVLLVLREGAEDADRVVAEAAFDDEAQEEEAPAEAAEAAEGAALGLEGTSGADPEDAAESPPA